MTIDERYFISAPLNQYFVDKDSGLPLAGGTLEFFRDNNHSEPKTVYQLTGTAPNYTYVPLPNPITLSSVGTVQNAGGDNEIIYFFPYDDNGNLDLYHIVCKSAGGVEQWTRDGWPNLGAGNDPTQDGLQLNNALSNCQFSRSLINPDETNTYTVTAASSEVFSFAPNWDLVISGTGDVIVERIAISGNDDVPTNPSYVLQISVASGVTECILRQRLSKNSGLFSGTGAENGFLAGNFVARNEGVGSIPINLYYAESSGTTSITPIAIVSASVDSTYSESRGAVAIPPSNNTDSGDDAYVDIYLSFPTNSISRITSVQVVPTTGSEILDVVPFNEVSANRDQARMGDYYIPKLEQKPIKSMLTGWDFTLNPAQELGENVTVDTTPKYVWDQTIMESITNDIDVVRDTVTGGLQASNGVGTAAFYMLQYLTGEQAKKILGRRQSVNITGAKTSPGTSPTCRVYLYSGSSAAVFPDLTSGDTIGTLNADGTFTLTEANWTEIPRSGLNTAKTDLKTIVNLDDINSGVDYGFSGWEIINPAVIADTDKFAIVVTCFMPDAGTQVVMNSISVVPGDTPTRPAPQTSQEVLQECEYYWEKSYATDTLPETDTALNGIEAPLFGLRLTVPVDPFMAFYADFIDVVYRNTKVTDSPAITFYSKAGTVDNVSIRSVDLSTPIISYADQIISGIWFEGDVGSKAAQYGPEDSSVIYSFSGEQRASIYFHYVVNARLGEAEYL
jgi:hypothetical protein